MEKKEGLEVIDDMKDMSDSCCIEDGLPICGEACKVKGFIVDANFLEALQDITCGTRCEGCCGMCFKGEDNNEESSSVPEDAAS
jgi:hypothetical protein